MSTCLSFLCTLSMIYCSGDESAISPQGKDVVSHSVLKTAHWQVQSEAGSVTGIKYDASGKGGYGNELAFQPLQFTNNGAEIPLKEILPSEDGRSVRWAFPDAVDGVVTLEWPVDLGPDGYYDRLTGVTHGAERPDHPALLRFIAGGRGHTIVIEALKRLPKDKTLSLNNSLNGESVLIETVDGMQFRLRHGAGGSASLSFKEGRLVLCVHAPERQFTLETYDDPAGIRLEDGAILPRFHFADDPVIHTSGGGDTTLNRLFDDFYLQSVFWYPLGHGISAWAAFGPIGHAYVDAAYRIESRNAIAGQVVGDDGYGHDGLAYAWGHERGWPFPGGVDTRHFGINAMHIVGAHTYLFWSGEYPTITGKDFSIALSHSGKTVLSQDVRGDAIMMERGSVYAQPFDTEDPFDTIGLYLDVPDKDPRLDSTSLLDMVEIPSRKFTNATPLLVREASGGQVAQRIQPDASFNSVGLFTCCWGTPGSGCRFRAFLWADTLAASVESRLLAETQIDSVPDNGYIFLDLDQTYPAGTEVVMVIDQPAPKEPGQTEMTGVWLLDASLSPETPILYSGNEPHQGFIARTAHGIRVPVELEMRLLTSEGEEIHADQIAVTPGKQYQMWALPEAISAGGYRIEARPVYNGIRWEASSVQSAFGGRATVNGHSFDWLARARREMDYQLDTLNAATDGLLLLDGRAGDKDHLGLTGQSVGNNYYDILPFGYYDGYSNAWYYASLNALADLEAAYGDREAAEKIRARLAQTRDRYSEVFWTTQGDKDGAARFIGAVDSEGGRHDYGFTFVNLLAATVGLTDQDQAEKILSWLDTGQSFGPDGAPRQDLYAFRFAPRCTTIDNRDWWSIHQNAENYPWGDQIQNGGGNLYESYFDLMTRLRTKGADDAYARFIEIMRRYAEPDRLTGGSPLFTGESVQGYDKAGATGIMSSEFPETAMLGGIVLYGFIGAEACAEGLVLHPRIPSSQPFIRAENILYHGALFTFEASHDRLRIQCTPRNGRYGFEIAGTRYPDAFVWEGAIPESGKILIEPFMLEAMIPG